MLEYAVMIFCVVAALLAMQVYIKRGMQGRLRQAGDNLGRQYDPKNTASTSTLEYSSNTTTYVETKNEVDWGQDVDGDDIEKTNVFATQTRSVIDNETTKQWGEEHVGASEAGLF